METTTQQSVKSLISRQVSIHQALKLFTASYLLVFLLSQLFTFDQFPELLMVAGIGHLVAVVIAILLVISELLALPYLIELELPKLLSRASQVAGFVALGLLTALELSAASSGLSVMFGATISLPSGAWSVSLLLAFWVVLLWPLLDIILTKAGVNKLAAKKV